MSTSGFQVSRSAPALYHRLVGQFMAPFVAELISRAVQPTDDVLDVACGTGFAGLAAAEVVGLGGSVTGLDINPGMLAYARTHDSAVSWVQASALDMPFEDRSFDSVVSQQGIQFFPDSVAGLREFRRVLRPGGRMAATVWTPMIASPLLHEETEMLIERCGFDRSTAEAASVPGEGVLSGWAQDAGFSEIEVDTLKPVVSLPPLAEFVPQHLRALPWAEPLFDRDVADQDTAIDAVVERLRDFERPNGSEVPFSSFIVTAVK